MINFSHAAATIAGAFLLLTTSISSAQTPKSEAIPEATPEATPENARMQPGDPVPNSLKSKAEKPKPDYNPDGTPRMAEPVMVPEPLQPSDTPVGPPPQPQPQR